jgi:hypothetical protein
MTIAPREFGKQAKTLLFIQSNDPVSSTLIPVNSMPCYILTTNLLSEEVTEGAFTKNVVKTAITCYVQAEKSWT